MVPVAEKADLSQVYNNIAVIYVSACCQLCVSLTSCVQGLMKKEKKEIEYIEKAIAVHTSGINVPRITLCHTLSRIVC